MKTNNVSEELHFIPEQSFLLKWTRPPKTKTTPDLYKNSKD